MNNELEFASDMELGESLLTAVKAVRDQPISDVSLDRLKQCLLSTQSESHAERMADRDQTPSTQLIVRSGMRRIAWVGASVVAVLLLIVFVSTIFTGISLADVFENVSNQPWAHEKYDDGEETWTSESTGKRFCKDANGRIQLFDDRNFVWMQYVPGDGHVTESRATDEQIAEIKQRKLTKTAIQALSPVPDGYKPLYENKKEKETVDGKELLRFDLFRINAFDQRVLEQQLWVDPDTNLPVRSRRYVDSSDSGSTERSSVAGTFDFPKAGPASIYELGIPAGLKIVRVGERTSPATLPANVDEVLIGIRKGIADFPARFRLLIWPIIDEEFPDSWMPGVDDIWWNGNPKRIEPKGLFSPGLIDWSGVKIRQERFQLYRLEDAVKYVPLGKSLVPESVLSFPQSVEEVENWIQQRTSDGPSVSDGINAFDSDEYRKQLQVTRINRGRLLSSIPFSTNPWPRIYQWPVLHFVEDGVLNLQGDIAILKNPPDNVPGTIPLRLDSAGGQRFDFYVDPAHDYICTKYVKWNDGDKRLVERIYELDDIQQFPSGQWYATRMTETSFRTDGNEQIPFVWKRAVDIRLLAPDEFPEDTFDGQKLTDDAKAMGYSINAM